MWCKIRAARVSVDLDLCQGHAVCVSECPEVFRIDPETQQVAILDPTPPEVLRPMVDAAVRHCPTHALKIADDTGGARA